MTADFKAEAERRALAERRTLKLTGRCRLDPVDLATSKDIPVIKLGTLRGVSRKHLRRLLEIDVMAFSASAVVHDGDALIVVNDSHTPQRQANSVAHELAHLILGHTPGRAFGEFGSRTISRRHEAEADWLAGCLLVPVRGLRTTMREHRNNVGRAAQHYGVSERLMQWRLATLHAAGA